MTRVRKGLLLSCLLACLALVLGVPAASAAIPAVTITSPADGATVSYPSLAISFAIVGQSPGDTVSCFSGTSEYPGCSSPWVPPAGDGTTTITVVLKNSAGTAIADHAIHLTITDSPIENPGGGDPAAGGQAGNDPDYRPADSKPLIGVWPRSARVGRKIKLQLYCPDGCRLALALKLGGRTVKGLKPVKVGVGQSTATIKLPSGAVKKMRAAFKRSKKTRAELKITPSSKIGKGRAAKISIRS